MASVRTGMADLINYVARLIDDESFEHHSEQDIQDALDQNRAEARYVDVTPVKSIAEGGAVTYLTFTAPNGLTHWESTGTLLDYNYATLTPATSDWMAGRWTFSSAPTRPVRILGYTFDVYGAAYDLLTVRSSMLSEDIQSFSAAQGSYSYAEKRKGPLELADKYLALSRKAIQTSEVIRTDVNILTW